MDTVQSIAKIIDRAICDHEVTYRAFMQKVADGMLTRDENPKSHFCVYSLPYNSEKKKVFIVHHKKAGLWIAPGGHIDKGEDLLQTLNREISEELGVKNAFKKQPFPFLLTVTPIDNLVQPCKTHYDVWFIFPTDGSNFDVDSEEFYETRWLTIEEARKIVTDPENLKAIEAIHK